MSDTGPTQPGQVRPMTRGDYSQGYPVRQPRQASDPAPAAHPLRDMVIGATVAAAAFWIVPKALEYAAGYLPFGGDDGDGWEGEAEAQGLEVRR